MRFGVLDSAPVCAGGSVADALAGSLARAERLEELGCHRLWFTEHHLAPDVASSSPLTPVGEAATRTRRMRLGAGVAGLVGSADTVRARLRDVARRLAPDEVMAMTDLPDPETTVRSHTRLAAVAADVAVAGVTG